MMKRLLVLIACLGLSAHLAGCTSHDAKQDSEVTSDYDSSELEPVEGTDISADGTATDDTLPDASSDASLDVDAGTDTASTDLNADSTDSSIAPSTPADEVPPTDTMASGETPVTDSTASTATDIAPPPADSSTTIVDGDASSESSVSSESTESTETAEAPKPASVPLQKIASTPWKVGKVWANALYFARPGDSLDSISQTIYGADKTDMLKRINPTYKSRDVKPGDKVYYNSPQRPDDSGRVATYYEDNGMQPEMYTAQAGDNIRKVSKELLGYPNAWKEVWASNEVDSKGEIPEGTQLRYWKAGAAAASVAQTEQAPPANPEAQAPPAAQSGEMSPPAASPEVAAAPPQEIPAQAENVLPPPPAGNELPPPPPPPPDMAQNEAALPPPPPPQEMAPPPPPPPPAMAERHHETIDAAATPMGMDSDTTMALAAVGLAAAGLAVLIVVRKKRKQKEMDHVMNDTQVGT